MHPRARNGFAGWIGTAIAIGVTGFTFVSSVAFAADRSGDAAPGEPVPAQAGRDHAAAKADRRVQALRRGINVNHWFAQVKDPRGYVPEHFRTYITVQDIELIRSLGFDHVRLSVAPEPMFVRGAADALPTRYLQQLDEAVNIILAQGLALIVDIHPDQTFKRALRTSNQDVEAFADFWRGLAGHLSTTDPERVFLEVLNEPEFEDAFRWSGVQAFLVSAIRQKAPEHTVIVSGHRWASLDDLLVLAPLGDPNLIYNFHFYSPQAFTHQAATWGTNFWHYLTEVPYPSSPDNTERLLAAVPQDVQRLALIRYGQERWNLTRIEAEIAEAHRWAGRHGVQVMCNEFGVHRKAASPGERAAWIRDVRTTLEGLKIGWTIWDYAGDFAMVNRISGKTVPDDMAIRALGIGDSTVTR
jgi:endoglucanase